MTDSINRHLHADALSLIVQKTADPCFVKSSATGCEHEYRLDASSMLVIVIAVLANEPCFIKCRTSAYPVKHSAAQCMEVLRDILYSHNCAGKIRAEMCKRLDACKCDDDIADVISTLA